MLIIWVQEENDIEGSVSYSRFRIDAIPARQGRMVGNTLRRTLLRQDEHREPDWLDQLVFSWTTHKSRGGLWDHADLPHQVMLSNHRCPWWQDLFRSYAPVAFRLRHRSCQVDKGKARSVVEVTAVTP